MLNSIRKYILQICTYIYIYTCIYTHTPLQACVCMHTYAYPSICLFRDTASAWQQKVSGRHASLILTQSPSATSRWPCSSSRTTTPLLQLSPSPGLLKLVWDSAVFATTAMSGFYPVSQNQTKLRRLGSGTAVYSIHRKPVMNPVVHAHKHLSIRVSTTSSHLLHTAMDEFESALASLPQGFRRWGPATLGTGLTA